MASLYQRATPAQRRALRIIEGAVKSAAHDHPELRIEPRFRRSIAKRATGTLTAAWPEVWAAPNGALSQSGAALFARRSRKRRRRKGNYGLVVARGAPKVGRRSPLGRLHKRCRDEMWALKMAGDLDGERARTLIDVFRWMAEIMRQIGAETDAYRAATGRA